jgi:hypothetical protein
MDLNPFDNVIVSEPRRIETPVSSLNKKPLDALVGHFDRLAEGGHPRAAKLASAQCVLSPTAGYGKSHLIGRVFKALRGRATLVYLRPFSDPDSCWQSILLKTVQEMRFPDNADMESGTAQEPNQLEVFAHGIIINIYINAFKSGAIRVDDKDAVIKSLKRLSLAKMRSRPEWIRGVLQKKRKLADLLSRQFRQAELTLNASPLSWLSVLIQTAYSPEDVNRRLVCLDWLKGGSVETAEAEAIGINANDRLSGSADMKQGNRACKNRVFDMCSLGGYYRPFVFCFDQTENYGRDPELAKTLGVVIQELVDYSRNAMIVMTVNQQPWSGSLEPHWEEAHRDRLARPFLELEGLNRRQGRELIANRLAAWDLGKKEISAFSDEDWLAGLFETPQLGVRQFLHECSRRWQVLKDRPPALPQIEDYFAQFVSRIKNRPRRLVYDPDILYWLVNELALPPGGRVEKYKSAKGYFTLRWKLKNRTIYFGFEPGANWSRWGAITRESRRCFESDKNCKSVYFRTPELKSIPGRWKIAPEIHAARETSLHIIELDRAAMAELYAAYDLYMAAVEGDIPFERDEVLGFLREQLHGFWQRVLEPEPQKWGGAVRTQPPAAADPSKSLVEKVREIMAHEKFLSLADLQNRISPPVSEQDVVDAGAEISEIRIHTSPEMTVFQWRPKG